MTTIPELEGTVRRLLTTSADALAKATGFVKRSRVVTGSGFAQAVVLGRLAAPDGTRKELQHSAAAVGMELSVQGLDQRFTPSAAAFMRALLEEGLTSVVTSETDYPILPQFNGVYITDCTRVEWVAGGVKVGVRLELQRGGLQVCLTEVSRHDQATPVADTPLPSGALHLGDLGFFKLKRFRDWSAQGVYWLTRYKIGTSLSTAAGQALDLASVLVGDAPVALNVRLGRGKTPVNAMLLAAPLPEAEYAKRLARLHEQARLDQRPLSQRQHDLAHWTIYLTNVPNLTFAGAHCLARTRWQIELLFKLWKSHGGLLRSRSADPLRQQVEGYAKLLGLLIAHWSLLVAGWQPHALGALDALRLLRAHLPLLRRVLSYTYAFADLLFWLRLALSTAAPRQKRRKNPAAFQLWHAFDYP